MISRQYNSLGFDLQFSVPETIDEYDRLAKKVGAALESATANVMYRSVFAKFRAQFAAAVENNTGIERKSEVVNGKDGQPKKDEEGTVVTRFTETEKVYFDRVAAMLTQEGRFESPEAAAASFAELAQTTIATIGFDPSESEAAPAGPKKVAKAYLQLAEKAASQGKLEALATTLATKLGNWKVEATVDSVAKAISEDQRRKREALNVAEEYGVS